MATITAAPTGDYTHYMSADVIGQSIAGNYSDVRYRYWVHRNTSAGYGAWTYDPVGFSVTVQGATGQYPTAFDFRSSADLVVRDATWRVTHDANGYANFDFGFAFAGHSSYFPATHQYGSMSLPRIPKVPGAPLITGSVNGIALGVSNPTTTSLTVRFSGTTDGGSAITGWEIQYAPTGTFTENVRTVASNGLTTITGLIPGTVYYFRARGRNGVGWGPFSLTASGKTDSALYVSNGSSWQPVEIYVSNGSSWQPAEVYISNGSAWQSPDSL